jgi:hypothetical protein
MPVYLGPGVYLEEYSPVTPQTLSRRLRHAPRGHESGRMTKSRWVNEHSTVAFLGYASQGVPEVPSYLSSWEQFESMFGGSAGEGYLAEAVFGYFANGGGECYVMRLSEDQSETLVGVSDGVALQSLEGLADVSIVAFPDMALCTNLETVRAAMLAMVAHAEMMGDRVAILDAPSGLTSNTLRDWRLVNGIDSGYAAVYYPWLRVDSNGYTRIVPPSGHVAGVLARVDSQRGVHKSAANEALEGAFGVELDLMIRELDLLYPIGLNPILSAPGRGPILLGDRTLSSDPARRLLSRRRLLNFIERNLHVGTSWALAEDADDRELWRQLRHDIDELFWLLWRGGILVGDRPEDAYGIVCDDESNPKESLSRSDTVLEGFLALEADFLSRFKCIWHRG